MSAAGKKMPVFASVPLIAGVAAVPSTSDSPSVPERISDMVMLLVALEPDKPQSLQVSKPHCILQQHWRERLSNLALV